MTIANNSIITALDLDKEFGDVLELPEDDLETAPLGALWCFRFSAVAASVSEYRRRYSFVVPFDVLLEAVQLDTLQMTAASTTTVRVTADDPTVASFPIEISGTTGAAAQVLTTPLFDGTPGNALAAYMPENQAVRVLRAGVTVTVTIETTSVSAVSSAFVTLIGRQFWRRA